MCFPAPSSGRHPPTTASTKRRKRPTVISNLSRRKELTVAGYCSSLLRLNVPPGTARDSQQLSSAAAPHLGASPLQLGNSVQVPSSQRWAARHAAPEGAQRPPWHTSGWAPLHRVSPGSHSQPIDGQGALSPESPPGLEPAFEFARPPLEGAPPSDIPPAPPSPSSGSP